ncbi:glycosyltransferase [Candidatus Enterovibrio altilux]|uniref:glycosyltransferase n=1 Tax=Candidatus Enterovibrio altilux TaxID=1927128 RepID=UPI00168161C7|nr:glycosyltransferase [Candidatus Enterovibrio luxaltus]
MKTIIQVVQHLKPGGIEVMALELMRFSNYKKCMKIISLEGNKSKAIKAWPRLNTLQNKLIFLNKSEGFSLSLIRRLNKLFVELSADIIHTHHIGPYFYAGIASRLAGASLIHTEHDAWHYSDKRHQLLHKVISMITTPKLVADADIVANAVNAMSGTSNIQVIKNGVDIDLYSPGDKNKARDCLNLPQDMKLIGTSGRLEDVKGHRILIEAMMYLPLSTYLAIAGIGSLENKLRELASNLNVAERVRFLGYIDNMPRFYQALDLFCLPSFNEGYPLAPLEAQACGIPTAVTNVGGATETLCPRTGVVLKAGDAENMATQISLLFNQCLAISPRQFVTSMADIRTMASAYDALVEG